MQAARRIFRWAGIVGILLVAPPYSLEARFGRENPPPINHPEFFYGFFGVALAWQFLFLMIASDPVRYRPAMLPAMLEKASFAIAVPILFAQGRVAANMLAASTMDGVWLLLFIYAYLRTPRECG